MALSKLTATVQFVFVLAENTAILYNEYLPVAENTNHSLRLTTHRNESQLIFHTYHVFKRQRKCDKVLSSNSCAH